MPLIPAILGNDIRVTPLLFHCQRGGEGYRNASSLVTDIAHFDFAERGAFFRFGGCQQGCQGGYENQAEGLGGISFFPQWSGWRAYSPGLINDLNVWSSHTPAIFR